MGKIKYTKNTEQYWKDRSYHATEMGLKSSDELLKEMKKLYEDSYTSIEKEINAFYGKYAKDNSLSFEEVNKRLNPQELKSFKKETNAYYNKINSLYKKGKISKELLYKYRNELRELSAKSYLSRLEYIKSSMRNRLIEMGGKEYGLFTEKFKDNIGQFHLQESYNADMAKGFSTGFSAYSEQDVNKLLNERWLGENYSDRIWKNKSKLVESLNNDLMKGIALGWNPNKTAKLIQESYQTSLYNCERLARTETIHLLNSVTEDTYKEHGIEKYQFVCDLSERTCPECGALDGQVFNLKDKVEGVNYPVIHPNCRCTTIPYFEKDEIDEMFEESSRVAYDGEGKIYEVPSSMSYNDWLDLVKGKQK